MAAAQLSSSSSAARSLPAPVANSDDMMDAAAHTPSSTTTTPIISKARDRGGGGGGKKQQQRHHLLASSYHRKLITATTSPQNNKPSNYNKQQQQQQQSLPSSKQLAGGGDHDHHSATSRTATTSSSSSSGAASRSNSTSSSLDLRAHLIADILSAVSDLKNAYSRLQSAHVLSDPDKLHAADQAVVAELKRMSELKQAYMVDIEKLATSNNVNSPLHSAGTAPDVHIRPAPPQTTTDVMILKSYEGLISNFQYELDEKNAIIENLKDMLAKTTLQKEKLEKKMKKLLQQQQQQQRRLSSADPDLTIRPADSSDPGQHHPSPSPQILEAFVLEASDAATSFTELLMSFMKMAEWNVEAAAKSIEPDLVFARRSHVKYAFEAFLTRRMLSGFESENFSVDSSLPSTVDPEARKAEFYREFQAMRNADPVKLLAATDSAATNVEDHTLQLFSNYCLKKFVEVIHPKMEESFFGSLQAHRDQISQGKHPTTQFYHCFLQVAKAMWLLHSLAFSFHPLPARIFQAHRDAEFSPAHMDSVIPIAIGSASRVGFTVMPGFHVHGSRTIIKCLIYPSVGPPSPETPAASS